MNKVVVERYHASFCQPCKVVAPVINELKNEFMPKGVVFKDVDIEDDYQLTEQRKVMSVPTVIIVRNGSEFGRITGVNPKNVFSDAIQSAL